MKNLGFARSSKERAGRLRPCSDTWALVGFALFGLVVMTTGCATTIPTAAETPFAQMIATSMVVPQPSTDTPTTDTAGNDTAGNDTAGNDTAGNDTAANDTATGPKTSGDSAKANGVSDASEPEASEGLLPGVEAFAADDWVPGEKLSYEDAQTAFLVRSKAVESAAEQLRSASTRYSQVDYLNDLVHQYDSFAADLKTRASTPDVMPEETNWPQTSAREVSSALADLDVEMAQVEYERSVWAQLALFEEAYQDVLYWEAAAKTYRTTSRYANQALRVARSHYKSGRGTYGHVLMAENRADLVEAEHDSAVENALSARKTLAARLELDLGTLLEVEIGDRPKVVVPVRDEVAILVVEASPMLRMARLRTSRSVLMVEWMEALLLPKLTKTARNAKADLRFITQAPYLVELVLLRTSAQTALETAERDIPAKADTQWSAVSDHVRRQKLTATKLISRASKARETALDGFRTGSATYEQLDAATTDYLELNLVLHKHTRMAAVANAMLDQLTGAELPAVARPHQQKEDK